MKDSARSRRYQKTVSFVKKHVEPGSRILDLGVDNPLSQILKTEGYYVKNTKGENLDLDFEPYIDTDADVITSFEVFEHMLAPYNILRSFKTNKLIASIPLKLWFASAYWNENNDLQKHYHEFEKKQFDFLLKKSGWKIKDAETWTSYDTKKIGIRPFLRFFTPRYYVVYCERSPGI